MNYNMVDDIQNYKAGNFIQHAFPHYINQGGSQFYSMDGINQGLNAYNNNMQHQKSIHEEKLVLIFNTQQRFIKLLKILINDQNNRKGNGFPFILPYQGEQIYIQFDPKTLLTFKQPQIDKRQPNLVHLLMQKDDKHEATVLRELSTRQKNDIRVGVGNSLDSRYNFQFKQQIPFCVNQFDQNSIFNTPKQIINYGQPLQASKYISPMNSFMPIMISQSFDPNGVWGRSQDSLFFNKIERPTIQLEQKEKIKIEVIPVKENICNQSQCTKKVNDVNQSLTNKPLNSSIKSSVQPEQVNSECNQLNKLSKKKIHKNKKRKGSQKFQDNLSDSYQLNKKLKQSTLNDTKNITKNFSKAIISFIIQNKDIGLQIMNNDIGMYEEFIGLLKSRKNQMTNIKQLRDLWTDTDLDNKSKLFNRTFRIIRYIIQFLRKSKYFLQKQSVSYVYNSRISNAGWHLKYRQNLLRALKNPEGFKYIKEI